MIKASQTERAGAISALPRVAAALALSALLAACGGGGAPEIRNGPQATHPSNSFLANGVYIAVEGDQMAPAADCYEASQGCQRPTDQNYTPSHNDGSTPIID
jgi:hypothetical protein